jgi:hypothetical protein
LVHNVGTQPLQARKLQLGRAVDFYSLDGRCLGRDPLPIALCARLGFSFRLRLEANLAFRDAALELRLPRGLCFGCVGNFPLCFLLG